MFPNLNCKWTKKCLDSLNYFRYIYASENLRIKLFNLSGYKNLEVDKFTMNYRGLIGMMQNEGLWNGLRVVYKYFTNKKIRKRMQKLERFFKNYSEYVGYGIYIGTNKYHSMGENDD